MRTNVTELLGIEHPVLQGAMHKISLAPLVAAVSEAGGLGILNIGTQRDLQALREEILKVRERTAKPFALNVTIFPSPDPPDYAGIFKTALAEGVRVFETAGRAPAEYMDLLKAHKAIVMHKCTALNHARTAEKLGVDIVTLVGFEAGGHPGESGVSSLVLGAGAAAALKIPFVLGGGFANGRALAAALMLGAGAVMMGTRFLMVDECPIRPALKEHLAVNVQETDTILLMRSHRNTSRVYNNNAAKEFLAAEAAGGGAAELNRRFDGPERAEMLFGEGSPDLSVLHLGESVGLAHEVVPAGVLIEQMVREAEAIIGSPLP
jgi:NAD(P)H-dependent flavin oxidoreductase YrpB (nitropropane dioxygenase family)